MAFKKTSRNRQPQDRRGRALIAPLPHSSWRLAPAAPGIGETPITSASEFWSRLGL